MMVRRRGLQQQPVSATPAQLVVLATDYAVANPSLA